jgi:hypothetical protein
MITNINLALVNRDGSPCLDGNGQQQWRGITQLWTMQGCIPKRYRRATIAMSRCHVFQNNVISWHEEQKSKFMWTRDLFIAACEEARAIDWDATRNKFAEKKELGQRVKDFTKATRTYRKALEKAPSQMGAPQKLTHFFNQMYEHYADQNQESWEPDLQDGMTSGLTNRNPLAALDALAEFFDGWDDLGKGAFQYGMIGYYKMQRRLFWRWCLRTGSHFADPTMNRCVLPTYPEFRISQPIHHGM